MVCVVYFSSSAVIIWRRIELEDNWDLASGRWRSGGKPINTLSTEAVFVHVHFEMILGHDLNFGVLMTLHCFILKTQHLFK